MGRYRLAARLFLSGLAQSGYRGAEEDRLGDGGEDREDPVHRPARGALGLRATIHPGGPLGPGYGPNVSVEGWLDAGAWRYTEELAQFVRELAEADRRLWERAKDDPPASVSEGVERLEQELGHVSGVCPYGQSARVNSHGSRTSSKTMFSPLSSFSLSSPGVMLLYPCSCKALL